MYLYRTLLFVLLACCLQAASARTFIVADQFVDVIAGKLIEKPVLIIEEDRIIAVNGDLGTRNQSDTMIELSGMTLLPGLIDTHVHLTSDAQLHGYRRLSRSNMRAALKGVKNARVTLLAGITTVRNLGAGGYGDVALRDAINDGDVIGPRMYVSGPALGMTGGHCDSNLLPPEFEHRSQGVANGPWAVAEKVRENIKYGADLIKFCATGGVLSKGDTVGEQQYSLEEMQRLVTEAHRLGRTVAAHAHGTSGIKDAIRAGVDSVEHGSFIDDEGIELAKEKGTYLSMDIYNTEYILGKGEEAGILPESLDKERQTGKKQRENFSRVVKAGVLVVMGTDAGVYPHGENMKQLSRMVRFGMSPIHALQAASINGAALLKQDQHLGSITEGKHADIIAVQGNPLSDITVLEEVQFVMKAGIVYKHTGVRNGNCASK